MPVEWLNCWLVLLGLTGLVLSAWALIRGRGRASPVLLLTLCFSAACLVTPVVAFALDEPPPPNFPRGPLTLLDVEPPGLGSPAPDFTLPSSDDGQPVRLYDLVGRKPVVLVFGSFGCDLFCERLDGLCKLHEQYHDKAEFLFVHVLNGRHQMAGPLQSVLAENHVAEDSVEGRRLLACAGIRHYHLPFRCVVDGDDNAVAWAYGAFPTRLIVVDRAGQIALDSRRGIHSGLKLDDVEQWLAAVAGHAQPGGSARE